MAKDKSEYRLAQDQYEMLKRCSKKKDITEWNQWREGHGDVEIWLEGANLIGARLEGADLAGAHLEGAMLVGAHLEDARLCSAHLEGAILLEAHLEGADLFDAHLEGARLVDAHLEGATLLDAHLEGARFFGAHLQGANFRYAIVDGETCFREPGVNRYNPTQNTRGTDFTGVGLGNVRIDPGTRQLIERNNRHRSWQEWYMTHPRLKKPLRLFWWISDYGMSTTRIIAVFFILAFVFANIYYHWARLAPPGIVSNLLQDVQGVNVHWALVPLRTLYFSVVTMTTLGFGDMYAKANSIFGHVFLMLQVLLGYVLLGALITRFAILFTAGGPAGKYTEMAEETKQLLAKIKEKREQAHSTPQESEPKGQSD